MNPGSVRSGARSEKSLLIDFQSPVATGKMQAERVAQRLCERSLQMPELHTLLTGLAFGESPRWHEGRLWVADWGAQEILAVTLEGQREVIVKVSFPSFPMCFDWLPDGRFLLVSSRDGLLLRRESGGELLTHADLSGLAKKGLPWNEIVIDGRGNAYINNQGFDFPGGEFAPGTIALLTPDGTTRQVADGIAFPSAHGGDP